MIHLNIALKKIIAFSQFKPLLVFEQMVTWTINNDFYIYMLFHIVYQFIFNLILFIFSDVFINSVCYINFENSLNLKNLGPAQLKILLLIPGCMLSSCIYIAYFEFFYRQWEKIKNLIIGVQHLISKKIEQTQGYHHCYMESLDIEKSCRSTISLPKKTKQRL